MKTTAAIALAVPLLIIGVPIFDTVSAIVRRIRSNRPIHKPDRGHIHHRLLDARIQPAADGSHHLRVVRRTCDRRVRRALRAGCLPLLAFVVLLGITGFMAHWIGLFEAAHKEPDEHH